MSPSLASHMPAHSSDIASAIIYGQADVLERYLEESPERLHQVCDSALALTPLMLALYCDHWEIAEALVAKGADVNQVAKSPLHITTPLIASLESSKTAAVQWLLEHGANPNLGVRRNNKPCLPLMAVAHTGQQECMRLLVRNGALLHGPEGSLGDPVIYAVTQAKPPTIHALYTLNPEIFHTTKVPGEPSPLYQLIQRTLRAPEDSELEAVTIQLLSDDPSVYKAPGTQAPLLEQLTMARRTTLLQQIVERCPVLLSQPLQQARSHSFILSKPLDHPKYSNLYLGTLALPLDLISLSLLSGCHEAFNTSNISIPYSPLHLVAAFFSNQAEVLLHHFSSDQNPDLFLRPLNELLGTDIDMVIPPILSGQPPRASKKHPPSSKEIIPLAAPNNLLELLILTCPQPALVTHFLETVSLDKEAFNQTFFFACTVNAASPFFNLEEDVLQNTLDKATLNLALLSACMHGFFELASQLLSLGANPAVIDQSDNTPLDYLVRAKPPLALFQKVFSQATPPKERLHLYLARAAQHGQADIAQFLIQAGADVNAENSRQQTPLYLAVANQHPAVARALIANGAYIRKGLPDKRSPLVLAASDRKFSQMVPTLLPISRSQTHLVAASFVAARASNWEALTALLSVAGAPLSELNDKRESLLWVILNHTHLSDDAIKLAAALCASPGFLATQRSKLRQQHLVTPLDILLSVYLTKHRTLTDLQHMLFIQAFSSLADRLQAEEPGFNFADHVSRIYAYPMFSASPVKKDALISMLSQPVVPRIKAEPSDSTPPASPEKARASYTSPEATSASACSTPQRRRLKPIRGVLFPETDAEGSTPAYLAAYRHPLADPETPPTSPKKRLGNRDSSPVYRKRSRPNEGHSPTTRPPSP